MTSMIADKTRAGLMGSNHVRRLARVESIVKDPLAFTDIEPTLDLDFTDIKGAPFAGNLTRATVGGYRMNSKGVMVPTVANEPVIDFGTDGKPVGTGFWGAYTNLLLRSEEFDNAAWLKNNLTVTANSIVGPDGATTMDTLAATVGDGGLEQAVAITPGSTVVHTASVYLKQGTAATTRFFLQFTSGGTNNFTIADLTWSTLTVALSGSANNKSYLFENLGNGLYRLSLSGSNSGGANTSLIVGLAPANNLTGNVGAWGAQLTATAFPVPYVPTTSATVTRNADSMVISGSDFTDFWNPTEGTFLAIGDITGEPASLQDFLIFYDGSSSNYIGLRQGGVLPGMDVVIYSGGPIQTDTNQANVRQGNSFSTALSMKKDQVIFVNDGLTVHSLGASRNMPVNVDRMRIAGIAGSGVRLKRLIYWPKALTATELQRMTA